jgi:hypothetical protein
MTKPPTTFQASPIALTVLGVALAWLPCDNLQADDDEIVALPLTANAVERAEANINFDQQIFPGSPSATEGRRRLETQIKLQLTEMDRACQLTAAQRERLTLAARGELQRFLEQVEVLRRKFESAKHDQDKLGQIWQEVQPLQNRQARGLTGQDTVLAKVLSKTLSNEQTTQFEAAQAERRRFRYEAGIGISLNSLEAWIALTKEQREALTKLLLELPPPRIFGQYDHMLVNYRLASLPPAKVQRIFDNRQWQSLQQYFAQARAMREHLIEQGYLSRDEPVITPEARP